MESAMIKNFYEYEDANETETANYPIEDEYIEDGIEDVIDDVIDDEAEIEGIEQDYEKTAGTQSTMSYNNKYVKMANELNGGKSTPQERFVFIMQDYHSGDAKLRECAESAAITELERFIVTIMKKNYPTYITKHFEDLIQEGRLGVCKGLEKYNPEKSKPTTFFYPYIKHEIQGYITTMIDKTTTHYSSNIRKINRVIERFEKDGLPYTPVDIAIQTGMTIETINQSMSIRDCRDEMHMDACPGNIIDEKATTKVATPEDEYIQKEQGEILTRVTTRELTPDQITALKYKYGIFNSKTMSEGQIAKTMGIPKEKVRRLINSALTILRRSELKTIYKDNYKDDRVLRNESDISFVPRESALAEIEELKNIDFA